MDKYIYNLKNNNHFSKQKVGGKAFNLVKLANQNINIPKGGVVISSALLSFLKHNNLDSLIQSQLNILNESNVLKVSKCIIEAIDKGTLSWGLEKQIVSFLEGLSCDFYAVRSSAGIEDGEEQSWAGQFDTFLNVRQKDVILSIKKCWASLFTPRAIQYSTNSYKQLKDLNFAVVIQEMIQSEKSGVLFSVEPNSIDTENLLIESVEGLGDKLVSGEKIPESLVVNKSSGNIVKQSNQNGNSPVLTESEIHKLVKLNSQLEELFGSHIDVEWLIKNNVLTVCQVRPITVLSKTSIEQPIGLDINDYEMTFKVTGLEFLFADILAHGFNYLEPLFISNNDEFKQYFTNDKMQYASNYGVDWLSTDGGFVEYQEEFKKFYSYCVPSLNQILKSESLDKGAIQLFFELISKLFTFYSKMDFQFTNTAYKQKKDNIVLRDNLKLLSEFKDDAREWINDITLKSDSNLAQFIHKISIQFNIPSNEISNYSITEISQLVEGLKVDSLTLNNRDKSYTVFVKDNKINYLDGNESELLSLEVFNKESEQISNILKGNIANKGKENLVRGNVSVINVDYSNFDAMNEKIAQMTEGNILVAEFTAPELILACKKAKAIVTDLGGMLSHAAIISRELNIPCLVATKSSSKSFKDGDEVILNMKEGYIKKI